MLPQAIDFKEECETLYCLLASCGDEVFSHETQFKRWTVNDVLVHLHMWNQVADWSLHDVERFETFMQEVTLAAEQGEHHQTVAGRWVARTEGRELLEGWHLFYTTMAERWATVDPDRRVKWAGPDMTAAMSLTARQMETWSHGQEIFDLLGEQRQEHDRIRNIVLLGVMTFGWTFSNRGLERPPVKPYVFLRAPSGDAWRWNAESEIDRIEGTAVDFARIVTQVRNVADTELMVKGEAARRWMAIAQCFAGSVEDPPAPGTRFPTV